MTFKDLESRGFIVIRNFLDNSDIQRSIEEYNQIKVRRGIMQGRCMIMQKFEQLIKEISNNTDLKINLINFGSAYFDTQIFKNSWHQDHEPYYKWQDGYHSINLWTPIIKPYSNQSGIEIIPFDNLAKKIPKELLEKEFIGKGAKSFRSLPNKTTVFDDEYGNTFELDFGLSEVSESPEINVGDAIVMRGDLLHKTQDTLTGRVAMSTRATNGDAVIYRDKYLSGCSRKRIMIRSNPNGFKALEKIFVQDKIEKTTVSEILKNL